MSQRSVQLHTMTCYPLRNGKLFAACVFQQNFSFGRARKQSTHGGKGLGREEVSWRRKQAEGYFALHVNVCILPHERDSRRGDKGYSNEKPFILLIRNYLGPLRFTQQREEADDHTEWPAKLAREEDLVCAR